MSCRAVLGLFLVFSEVGANPQTINVWTNPTSGNWEDLHWSLGQLPAPGQSIMLTNSGWKAVAIGPATVQNFSQTLNPFSITLGAGTDSFNVLLLNFTGFQNPLSVSELVINSNSAVTALSSTLNVNNTMGTAFSIGGAFNHGDFSVVSALTLKIGDVGPGVYNLTNGTLLVTVTQSVGSVFLARFNQFGGTNYPGNLLLSPGGECDVFAGALITSNIIYRSGGSFNQLGGLVKPDKMLVNNGLYAMSSGTFSSSDVELPGVSSAFEYAANAGFLQTGGTNNTAFLSIGNWRPPFLNASSSGGYTLSNGVLNAGSTAIGPYGAFTQSGGTHNTGLGLFGDIVYYYSPSPARYFLSDGFLFTPGIGMRIGLFTQTGGTNQVSGDLTMQPYVTLGSWTAYNLSGGFLMTSNTYVGASMSGGFYQSGGTHIVSSLLTISQSSPNFAGYVLSGGELIVRNIQVDGGATFHHCGGTLINTNMVTLADGIWAANTNDQQCGKLVLVGSSNSIISLPAGRSVLRFAQSSSVVWSNQATLTIENWNGSVSGGGQHQIHFGNDAAALSSQQLAQIQFHNPLGQNGTYPAAILSTGEIVPNQFLVSRFSSEGLELSWAPGMTLQSATTVYGPFRDVPEASSPYTITSSEPQRFFRLRR